MIPKFFVYGTLKLGGYFSGYFTHLREKVVEGTIKGTMYNLNNRFPGVVLEGDCTIIGEIHTYKKGRELEVLHMMDSIEGYRGKGNIVNLYDRTIIPVTTKNGTEECIIYTINMKLIRRENISITPVKEGIWKI